MCKVHIHIDTIKCYGDELVSRFQKGKTSLDLNKARDGVLGCSGISWTICNLHLTPTARTNSSSLNCFTNRMLFLMPNQQCQSMEGSCSCNYLTILRPKTELNIHSHTRLMALCPGVPGWAGTRKVKPIWILLKQETVSSSGISWAICKCAPRSRQITMPAPPPRSVFYRPDALPAAEPTVSKHWRHIYWPPKNKKTL